MSNLSNVAEFDTLRSLNFSAISGTYAQVGTTVQHNCRAIGFTNNTNGDLFISFDGVNDNIFLPAGGLKVFDIATNTSLNNSVFELVYNLKVYVKQSTAPSSGDFYLEVVYARGS
jgi:hypothetical protein